MLNKHQAVRLVHPVYPGLAPMWAQIASYIYMYIVSAHRHLPVIRLYLYVSLGFQHSPLYVGIKRRLKNEDKKEQKMNLK